MELLPQEIADLLPGPYETEDVDIDDKVLIVKFFTPDSQWTWYAAEYDPDTRVFFGYVQGLADEWGYFSLDEMEDARGPLGLRVERDLNFKPMTFSKLTERAMT